MKTFCPFSGKPCNEYCAMYRHVDQDCGFMAIAEIANSLDFIANSLQDTLVSGKEQEVT